MENILLTNSGGVPLCKFCTRPCVREVIHTRDRRCWISVCGSCNVTYTSIGTKIQLIQFESKTENNRYYTIDIDLKNKRTRIILCKMFFETSQPTIIPTTVASFDTILEINPFTFPHKLKTYLTFL